MAGVILTGAILWLATAQAVVSRLGAAEGPPAEPPRAAPPLPPLVIDQGAPLLLAEPEAEAGEETTEARASLNAACYVCHGNYEREALVGWHAAEDIGCVECHGPSFAHRNDENNTTPPDVIYAPEAIEAACQRCHDTHDAKASDVIARWQQRCPQQTDASRLVCTDCHGEHRLARRTVRWDKKTRALLPATEPSSATANDPAPAPPSASTP